jgi:hypothetical protein
LVDITRCEKCGKVIPALETGCAWCDAEEARRGGFREDDWMPLSIRMLLWMFLVNVGATAVLSGFGLAAGSAPLLKGISALRLAIAIATLAAILGRHPSARWLPFVFLGWEACWFAAVLAGWLEGTGWFATWFAPVWNLLFAALFVRDDVRARLDRRSSDQLAVGRLLEEFRQRQD